MRNFNLKQAFLLFALLLCAFSLTALAQVSSTFTSYTGGFTINLPKRQSGGNGMAGGIAYSWRQLEAEYEVGFYELQGLSLAKIDGEFSFEQTVKQYFNKFSARGERIYAKDISLQENKGREYKYKTDKSIFLLRLFSVKDRIYKLLAEIPLANQNQEEKVLRVFDSFRLMDQETVNAVMAKKLADATPPELPQSPIVPKLKSDAQDGNLKGNVKSVLTEMALYAVNNSLRKPQPQMLQEFNKLGNLVKQIEYDSYGNPFKVTVYGYIAGKRVSRIGNISHEYDIGGIMIDLPQSVKFDDRFQESYAYKYLGNNLTEQRTFWSNGGLFSRFVYRYRKGEKESIFYDGGKVPFRKAISKLDEKSNEIEVTVYELGKGEIAQDVKFKMEYESFDVQENWTKRINYKSYDLEGNGNFYPKYVEYRTITYHE